MFAEYAFGAGYYAGQFAPGTLGPANCTYNKTLRRCVTSAKAQGGRFSKGAGWLVTMSWEQSYAYWKQREEASRRVAQRGSARIRTDDTRTYSVVGDASVSGVCTLRVDTTRTTCEIAQNTASAGCRTKQSSTGTTTEMGDTEVYAEENFTQADINAFIEYVVEEVL